MQKTTFSGLSSGIANRVSRLTQECRTWLERRRKPAKRERCSHLSGATFAESLESRELLAVTVFSENFESGTFNASKWSNGVVGTPVVLRENTSGGPINSPNGIYALNLDGYSSARGEAINSKTLNLSGYKSATLSYRVQAGGNGDDPDTNPPDFLNVAYKRSSSDSSNLLFSHSLANTSDTGFEAKSFSLPKSALTSTFYFGFSAADSDYLLGPRDDWFIDDVKVVGVPKTPDISINDRTVTEGGAATFTVSLSEKTAGTVTVRYATESDSAGTSDYVAKSGTVTFNPGQTSKTITVATREDSIDELSEQFNVRLSNPSGGVIVDSRGIGTINDDDPTPQIRIAATGESLGTTGAVDEGETASFTVSLDRPSSRNITVAYATSEGSAIVDDFSGTSGTLTFSPGQTSKTVTVTTLEDNIFEGSESFSVSLSNPSSTAVLSSSYRTSTFDIVDDDPLPTITVSPASGIEGDSTADPLSFVAALSNPSSVPISVDYTTADDTAVAGVDYVARSGTLNFAPLATDQSFTVALIGDDLDEGDAETFLVRLTNPVNTTIANTPITGTITDDDFAPMAVGITGGLTQYVLNEGDGFSISAADTTDQDSSDLLYRWDINNDGEFDIVSESTEASLSATQMAALGLNNGNLTTTLRLEVSDGTNTESDIVPLVITNVAPEFHPGDDILLPPEASGYVRRSISFTDPGVEDLHFVTIDYGDGSAPVVTALEAGTRSFALDHQYLAAGQFEVQISLNDGDGTTTQSLTTNVTLGSSLPEASFSGMNATVSEADDSLTITASLAFASTETAVVPLIFGGSAIRGGDYLPTSSFLEFAPGETNASVVLQLVNDRVFEGDETIDVLMGIPTGARLGNDTFRRFTITSDDSAPRVEFTSAFQIAEEGDSVQVTAQLSSPSAEDVTIPLEFFGSATADASNFQFPGSTIVIPAGSLSAAKTLLITDDTLAESAQVLLIGMGVPTGAIPAAAPGTTVQTIIIPANDTPIVDLRAANVQVDEDHGTVAVLVDLSNPINESVAVPYTLSGTATNGADFSISPDTPLTFAAGQTSAAIDLTVIDDLLAEPFDLETVVITFGSPDVGVLGNTRSFELAIVDNEVQRIDFTLDRQEVWEDNGTITFTIESTRIADSDITVPINIVPGSARLDDLGSVLPTEVVLPAGQNSATFTIPLADDERREGTESFTVELTDPIGAQLGEITAHRVTIKDDDPLVYLTVEQSATVESRRGVNFTFRLSAPTNDDVTVQFQRFGTASLGTDYSLSHSSSVVIPAGERTATVTATLKEDAQVERDESIGLRITGISGTNPDSIGRKASFVVRNDDVSYAYFSTRPAEVREGQAFDVTVSLTEALPSDVRFLVSRNILSNSASPNVDYTVDGLEQRKYLRVPAGQTSASFRVSIKDDDYIEGPELIELKLSRPSLSSARVDSVDTLRYVIAASDTPTRRVVLRAPHSFGLNQADLPPGVILVSDDASAAELGGATVVDLGIDGNLIELPAAEAAKAIDKLLVDDGNPAPPSSSSSRTSASTDVSPYTLIVSGTGGLTPLELKSAQLENFGLGNVVITESPATTDTQPLTLAIDVNGGNSNFHGSTLFFDANFNGVPDFLDLNGDGIQQAAEPVEPFAETALDGSAKLELPYSMDVNADGVLDALDGRFVLIGGIDTATELPLRLRMESAIGHFNVSPLSTVASKLVHSFGLLPTDAEARILSAVQVEGASFARTSVVAAAAAGDTSAVRMAVANAKIQSTAMAVSSLFSGISGAPAIEVLGDLVFLDMADKIRADGSLLDLASASVVESIIRGVSFQTGLALSESQISTAVSTVTAINERLDQIDASAPDSLTQRAKLEIVAIGQLSSALADLTSGNIAATDVLNDFTGASLDQRVAAASPGIITPPRVAITSYRTLEGDGAGTLVYEVRISGEVTRPVTVTYETVDGDQTHGEFTPVSGTLTWQPGESDPQRIEVPYVGDDLAEGDEAVIIGLTSVTNAVLANDLGAAYMVNDDAFTFTASSETASNDLQLVVDGGDVTFDENGMNVLAGTFSEATTSTISGADGIADTLTLTIQSDSIFLAGGLNFYGQMADGDALHIKNATAQSVTQRITENGSGSIDIEGQVITYNGLATISDLLLPEITNLPTNLREADSISLGSLVPQTDDPADLSFAWLLTRDDEVIGSSNSPSFQHTFADDGDYEISLTISASGRATSTQIIEFPVANVAPMASIDAVNGTYSEGHEIAIVTSATDPAEENDELTFAYQILKNGESFSYESGIDQTEYSFIPDDNGSYEIVLTVSDEDEGSTTVRQTISVDNITPSVSAGGSQVVSEGDVVTLAPATFNDLGTLDTHTATIDWGDGSPLADGVVSESPFGPQGSTLGADGTVSGSHVYADNGIYTVTVTVTDDDGAATSDSFQVTVSNVAPTVDAGDDHTTIEGATVTLDPATFNDLGTLDTHTATIDWGDGSPLADGVVSESPFGPQGSTLGANGTVSGSHVYADNGVYTVTVTVTDDDGAATSDSFQVTVSNVAPTVAVEISETEIDENGVTILSGQISDPGTLESFTLSLNWGDDLSPDDSQTFDLSTVALTEATDGISWNPESREFSLSHQYLDDNGSGDPSNLYTIVVGVTDDDAGQGMAETSVTVHNIAPTINELDTTSSSLATRSDDGDVTLTGQFSDIGVLDTHTVMVDWGDGSDIEIIDTNQLTDAFEGLHSYASGGIYSITVIVTDDDGGSVAASTTAVVTGVGLVDGTLYIVGTDGRDHVKLDYKSRTDEVTLDVDLNRRSWLSLFGWDRNHSAREASGRIRQALPASTVDRIVTHLFDGDDRYDGGGDWYYWPRFHSGPTPPVSQIVFGGGGNDRIVGGNGNDALFGGDGHDYIKSSYGDDILVGGEDWDLARGGRGDDLLIGETLSIDWESMTDVSAIDTALAEWASGDLADTLDILGTIVDDDDRDLLFGDHGADTLLYGRERRFWR